MLDDERTTADTTSSDATAGTPVVVKAAPRRRRAASRPAGPSVDGPKVETHEAVAPATAAPKAEKPPKAEKAAKADKPAKVGLAKTDAPASEAAPKRRRATKAAAAPEAPAEAAPTEVEAAQAAAGPSFVAPLFQAPDASAAVTARRKRKRAGAAAAEADVLEADLEAEQDVADDGAEVAALADEPAADDDVAAGEAEASDDDEDDDESGEGGAPRRRRRRGGRRRKRAGAGDDAEGGEPGDSDPASTDSSSADGAGGDSDSDTEDDAEGDDDPGSASSRRRRRRRRGGRGGNGGGEGGEGSQDDPPNTVVRVRQSRPSSDDVSSLKGSTRLEAKKQRRREGRDAGRRRAPILTEAEFLARREDVDRVMVVRQVADRVQIGVLEDDVLVEHYVNKAGSQSLVGNVYLGKVQNVLPSMEAAFVDIGRGRNAVLYAGEVNWDAAGLDGQPKRIEFALKSGDSVLVQVTKDPLGHKGARLTSQISLPGRYLVYVPDGSMTGISRKLPDVERTRLKRVLRGVVPEDAGVIVRTAAEGASEEELERDVSRLAAQWEDIRTKSASTSTSSPALLYGEPDLAIRVVRDIFNEDFAKLVVSGADIWQTLHDYVTYVAPDLADRLEKYVGTDEIFSHYRIDEQLAKGLDRKVWLPSGGSLVIDRTEAMTVVDVNTGKFTGQGGNLEETVTRNNLEAAEEIVRQLRLRDIGGIIVVDFIDMVLESNRDLVLRRLVECLGRDRTKHQVAEVTSLGLVQMTRKRIGQGLLETFSESCEACNGRGVKVHVSPVEAKAPKGESDAARRRRGKKDPADLLAKPAAGSSEPAAEAAVEPAAADADEAPAAPKARTPRKRTAKATAKAPADATSSAPAEAAEKREVAHTDGTAEAAATPAKPARTRKRATKAAGPAT